MSVLAMENSSHYCYRVETTYMLVSEYLDFDPGFELGGICVRYVTSV
jgi:hypothetical protein